MTNNYTESNKDFERLLDDFIQENLPENEEQEESWTNPALMWARASLGEKRMTFLNASGWITLRVRITSWPEGVEQLSLLCYDENYVLMSRKRCRFNRLGSGVRSIRLRSERIWFPGRYQVFLFCDEQPFGKVDLELMTSGKIRCESSVPADDENLTIIATAMVDDETCCWSRVCGLNGGASFVDALMANFQCRLRDKKKKEGLQGESLFICGDSAFHSERMAVATRDLFLLGRRSFDMVDCESDEPEWRERQRLFLEDRKGRAFALRHIHNLLSPSGRPYLEAWLEALRHPEEQSTVIVCGTREVIDTILRFQPEIRRLTAGARWLVLSDPTPEENTCLLIRMIRELADGLTAEAEDKLYRSVLACWDAYGLSRWTGQEMDDWVSSSVIPAFVARLDRYGVEKGKPFYVGQEDIDLAGYLANHPLKEAVGVDLVREKAAFDEANQELSELVGLRSLKASLSRTFMQVLFNRQRKRLGLPVDLEAPHHMIFTGNPGTGKTTVAKLMGKLYKFMGLLSDGGVVVTERTQLVGTYIGQTEERMRAVLDEAKGKVLFIDEAYTLLTDEEDRRDFGNHVIDSLLTVLSEPRPDMLIILAGYEEEMERLLRKNPGLKSRFVHKYHFEDYTADELFQIAHNEFDRYKYLLSPEAETTLRELIRRVVGWKQKDFGNARWVKQLVGNGILPAMAERVILSGKPCVFELYTTIERVDVERAAEVHAVPEMRKVKKVGFVR